MRTADVAGELPTGTSVLEASAGTGKTWTIAALVARYIAEGHARIDELLVVTFGRAATSDLRSRVRERLVSVHAGLGRPSLDPVVTHLNTGDVEASRRRLAAALSAFDSATVATTHSFCDQVLRSLGILSDLDPGTLLVESLDELLVEAVHDLYLQKVTALGAALPFSVSTALSVARKAMGDPQALLLPEYGTGEAALRVELATLAIAEVERRKLSLRVLSFDDLLSRVRDCLVDPVTGPIACQRLRDRFRIALVDEFQDTDPVQWDVLHSAFHGHRTLVVIGDPKQAIYAFRGADVTAYLNARDEAGDDQIRTLGTNWRSDTNVVEGVSALLRGAALGDGQIVVGPVVAGHTAVALGPAVDPTPVRIRLVKRSVFTGTKDPAVDLARETVARDCASQVLATLGEGLTFTPREQGTPEPLVAGDIAVIVRTGNQARKIREALLQVGIPSVVSIQESVFSSTAASDWLLLLEALEQPHRSGQVRRFSLSAFVGLHAEDLAADGSDAVIDRLSQHLRDWADVLTDRGVAGLFAAVSEHTHLAERLLGVEGGERSLTDLRHVTEIVHGHALEASLGLSGLVAWLRDQVADADDSQQERSRRLDSERSAVQVVTVHTSKGLEYPVVFVPYGWDKVGVGSNERSPRGHDADGRRTLHLGGKTDAGYQAACAGEDKESEEEDLRLLYVALTRAISRLVLWWAPSASTKKAALPRLLLCSSPSAVPASVTVPADDALITQLRAVGGPCVAVQGVDVITLVGQPQPSTATKDLALARFGRPVDRAWRRTSYTGLTRDVEHGVGSEAPPVKDDEADLELPGAGAGLACPLGPLPGGPAFGTLVHEALELADLTVRPVTGELRRVLTPLTAGTTWDLDLLVDGLALSVATPLAPYTVALQDLAPHESLRELAFELPLAGGDLVRGDVRLSDLAAILRQHLPEGDPVRGYADRVPQLGSTVVRGYLNGSIDLVLRIDGAYVVADHKTNRLARRDVDLTTWHYRNEALDSAMLDAHYPLQALLYVVAVHRYLRWRVRGYDPSRHLGGVQYLFLRGMVGEPSTGVWWWKPPAPLVLAVSDWLAGA